MSKAITTRKSCDAAMAVGLKRLVDLQVLLVPTSEFISVKSSEKIAIFCEYIY
jgi:hypothetical protein